VPTREELEQGFRIGDWEVLPARAELRRGDEVERPEPKVMETLLALAESDGEVLSRDELVEKVWGGRPVADDPINQCISKLRGALGDREKPYRYVEALVKRGYRLKLPVQLLEAAEQAAPEPALPPASLPVAGSRLWLLLGAAGLAVAVALIGALVTKSTPPAVGSIAVLPCENQGGNAEDEYRVSGFKDELVATLHNIPDFTVKHGRIQYPDLEVDEIAAELGVESVLFCAVQRDHDRIKVNYHVARGSDGMNISSGSITGGIDSIFALQERLATALRNDLLGKTEQDLVSTSRPASNEAFDLYMTAKHAFSRRGMPGNLENAIRLFEKTTELDPHFGPAYLSLAMAYALLPDARNAPLDEAHARAIAVVEKGIHSDASITEAAQTIRGFVHHKRKAWLLAEQAYQRSIAAEVVDPNAFNWYSLMLAGVGRLDDALEMALEAQRRDPSNGVYNSRVAIAYTWLGDGQNALEYFDRARLLGGTSATHYLARALVLQRLGRFDEAMRDLEAGVSMAGGRLDWIDPVFAGLGEPGRRADGIAALDAAAAQRGINPQLEVTLRAMLGDVDGAVRVAGGLARRDVGYEIDLLFLPELEALRQRAEFQQFMDSLGIREYWDAVGCAWQDTTVACPEAI
jgi:DNA-binding winged helix-turn-helix (wHTH) protein/TolB-like protein/Tfp pilus assembly protein PilF